MEQLTGILLFHEGYPEAPEYDAVKAFLQLRLLNKRVAPKHSPLWGFKVRTSLAANIAKKRAKTYKVLWPEGEEPFVNAPAAFAQEMQELYAEQGVSTMVRCVSCFDETEIQQALSAMRKQDIGRLVLIPLFPQASHSTTNVALSYVSVYCKKNKWSPKKTIIREYFEEIEYIQAIANCIRHAGFDASHGDKLLFAYRPIPYDDIDAGDQYELHAGTTSLMIASELGIDRTDWTIGYHDALEDGRSYLAPTSRSVVRRWAETAAGRVFVVCPGNAFEAAETLYGVRRTLRKEFTEVRQGASAREVLHSDFVYVRCLGKSRVHAKMLMSIIQNRGKKHE